MFKSTILSLCALTSAVSGAAIGPLAGLYFLDDDPSGANVVAMALDSSGMPSNPVKISTGGNGATANVTIGGQPGLSPLVSQGPVRVYGNYLFTVNAGSNTVVMFEIDNFNSQCLTMIGSPAPLMGDFPVSLDYSPDLHKVCVLTGGKTSGVQCFKAHRKTGLESLAPIRVFPSSLITQTDPPNGPGGTASQILFSPDSSCLIVALKGNEKTINGSFSVFPIFEEGGISRDPVVSEFSNVILPFAMNFISDNEIFFVDPAYGASLLTLNSDYTLTQSVHTPITGMTAVCWSTTNLEMGTLYAVDAGQNNLWVLSASTGAVTGSIPYTPPTSEKGMFDSVVSPMGMFYGLGGSPGIEMINTMTSTSVGFSEFPSSLGNRQNFAGMAYWQSPYY